MVNKVIIVAKFHYPTKMLNNVNGGGGADDDYDDNNNHFSSLVLS